MNNGMPSDTRLDQLNDVADAFATLLHVEPEQVMIEPRTLRLSLTLDQAQQLVRLIDEGRQQS